MNFSGSTGFPFRRSPTRLTRPPRNSAAMSADSSDLPVKSDCPITTQPPRSQKFVVSLHSDSLTNSFTLIFSCRIYALPRMISAQNQTSSPKTPRNVEVKRSSPLLLPVCQSLPWSLFMSHPPPFHRLINANFSFHPLFRCVRQRLVGRLTLTNFATNTVNGSDTTISSSIQRHNYCGYRMRTVGKL